MSGSLRSILCACAATAALAGTVAQVCGQAAGLEILPGRAEVEVQAGLSRAVTFQVQSPPSEVPIQGNLVMSMTDWAIDEDGQVTYADPSSQANSASGWVGFTPSALTIASGETQNVQVTVSVPENTRSGVYRTGIFVQERPPAAPTKEGEHVVYFRFRYLYSLYVVVGSVAGKGDVVDLRMVRDAKGMHLVCEMQNAGTRPLRPRIDWFIRDAQGKDIRTLKRYESTVLLDGAKLRESLPVENQLPPGEYEIEVQVDFRDGTPVQSVKRQIRVKTGDAAPAAGVKVDE